MSDQPFIHDDFLLDNKPARRLYHDFAESMPIIDYHSHLSPADIATDRKWENLTQIWLAGDHYKWRLMRTCGVAEFFCTGQASDREKFQHWASVVPQTLRNPIYHWTHLELKRYFNYDRLLSPETADQVWKLGNSKLASTDMSARGLMQTSNVVLICTTDDPTDTLEYHQTIASDKSFNIRVLPTWRPDKALAIDQPQHWNRWVDALGESANITINDFDSFLNALQIRQKWFHECGCRLADHGVETIYADHYTHSDIHSIFRKARNGSKPDPISVRQFKNALLYELCLMNGRQNWTQQIHFGAMRNNNTRMFQSIGPDTGFDSIGDWPVASALAQLLDRLNTADLLAKTVIYNLNPRDNALITSMLGNFQNGSVPGKMQHGSAWWFLDSIDGMTQHIETLSAMGLISRFVGMLTDSRSFLSFTRHEYFRRLLCNLLGNDIAIGRIPSDFDLVGNIVRDVCFHNAADYFGFDLPDR